MKIKHLAIVIFAVSLSFASCSSNEDSDDIIENPVSTKIPKVEFISGIVAGTNRDAEITITLNPIEKETIKNYEIKTELTTTNTIETISKLSGSKDVYLGSNKIQVIATNTSNAKIALDSLVYKHKILQKFGGTIPRELVLEKDAAGIFTYSVTAKSSDYSKIKVEINDTFLSSAKTGSIAKTRIKENESNTLKLTFFYGITGQNKTYNYLNFRVRNEDLK